MATKLSHSAKSKWLMCGELYRLHYVDRIRSTKLSSALLFGSAMDLALNHLLLNKDSISGVQEAIQIFAQNWEQGVDARREKVDLPLNPLIEYFKSDYDADLLEKSDWRELLSRNGKFFDMQQDVNEKLKNKVDWLDIPEEDRMLYNYANWMCLSRKGKMFLEAYAKEILPKIKRVICVQKDIEIFDEENNSIPGVVDLVAELQDGRVAVIDNKTSSQPYEENSVRGSEQLAQYQAILNMFNDEPENEWKHKIDVCAYAVIVKKLDKLITKTCSECGHIGEGSHKTCDNVIDKKRCNGAWNKDKQFTVQTQFIVDSISPEFQEMVLENATTVISCVDKGIFPRNLSACADQFGKPCVYFSRCHDGKDKGLIKLEDSKK